MTDETTRLDGVTRRKLLQASAGGIGALGLAGCMGDGSPDPPVLAGTAPKLDLDTLQADTPIGTVEAERAWENAYVGAVDEDLYIAVSLSEGTDTGDSREATVYLCDGTIAELITGEVGPDTTTLQGDGLDVELSLTDDGVGGTVMQDGEELRPFTSTEASGVAGLYSAQITVDDTDYLIRWIVLTDGSQRGVSCCPPFIGCCDSLCCGQTL